MKDYKGKKFGKLTIIEPTDKRENGGYIVYKCKCDCGRELERTMKSLSGKKNHCCPICQEENRLKATTKHSGSRSRIYQVHKTIIQRCTNPNAHEYENYGGRGITVCDEWLDFETFREWAYANGYTEDKRGNCTIDRIDTNKGYSPDNCRWVSMKTQQRNRRNNVLITYNGETHCMSEWAEIIGIKYVTLQKRLYAGWSIKDALTKPLTY